MSSKSICSLGKKKIFFIQSPSKHTPPSSFATAGNTFSGMLSRSAVAFLVISPCDTNHFPVSMVFRLGKNQKSHSDKLGEYGACETGGVLFLIKKAWIM